MKLSNICSLLFCCFMSLTADAQVTGVSCCDWMMLKRQKLGEFQLSKDIKADGVEMDMGSLGKRVYFDSRFRLYPAPYDSTETVKPLIYNKVEIEKFRGTADSLGVRVSSIAMSGFFAQNFLKRPNYRTLVLDCLNTMAYFGCRVAFLPLGGSGHDWETEGSEAYNMLVERLAAVGEMAAQRDMVIGIRTGMPAAFGKRLVDKANNIYKKRSNGKCGIAIYYNLQDACDNGWDICKELTLLGSQRVCQIHCSNTDSVTLRNDPEIDLPKILGTLKKIGYKGWLTVERSRNAKDVKNVRGNYGDNVAYIKETIKEYDK